MSWAIKDKYFEHVYGRSYKPKLILSGGVKHPAQLTFKFDKSPVHATAKAGIGKGRSHAFYEAVVAPKL